MKSSKISALDIILIFLTCGLWLLVILLKLMKKPESERKNVGSHSAIDTSVTEQASNASAAAKSVARRSGLDNVRKGEQFEAYMAKLLELSGFSDVRITPATGDFGVDIIGEKNGKVHAVQCKYYSTTVGLDAVQQVYAGAAYYDCSIAIVATNNKYTSNAVKLASKIGVNLWDGDKIKRIEKAALNSSKVLSQK